MTTILELVERVKRHLNEYEDAITMLLALELYINQTNEVK